MDLLLSKPSKKHFRIYGSDTTKIQSFSYHEIDRPTLDQLSAVEIDLERLKMNTELGSESEIQRYRDEIDSHRE